VNLVVERGLIILILFNLIFNFFSSLLRVISKLWPLFNGNIEYHGLKNENFDNSFIFFLPQVPYLNFGSFKQQIIYPDEISKIDNNNLLTIIKKVNLGYIFERIGNDFDAVRDWGSILSPGEQQKLSFARLIYHKPVFAILDESTSALDLKNEKLMYKVVCNTSINCISVGHRLTLQEFHNKLLEIEKKGWFYYNKNEDKNLEIKKNKLNLNL
jgi:vitamin B12/bleomycin/antimicrobial peptide transport system ATP-binding/permease protein